MSLLTDIQAHLQAAGVVPASYAMRLGIMPPTPDQVVAIFAAGGPPTPTRRLGIDRPAVQIRVRGATDDHEGPLAVATAVERALHEASGTLGATAYPWVLSQHAPLALGVAPDDTRRRPEYVCNFQLAREAA